MHTETPGAANRPTLNAMVAFIKANLVKTASDGAGGSFLALSETAIRFNDTSWFWTDDNAKAAELLCEPALYDADGATADAAIDFVLRMSQGAVIQRRCAPAELRVLSTDPKAFRVETAFFIVEGDLTLGIVRHALRFNDGRTVTAAQHTGNMVSFRHRGRSMTLDVEKTITRFGVEVGERSVTLSHTSTLRSRPTWFSKGDRELAELTYTYTVHADRPSVGLTVALTAAPGSSLRRVELSTGCDQLTIVPGVDYRAFTLRTAGETKSVRTVPDGRVELHRGPAEYCAIVQEGASPGFSYAIHTLLRDSSKLSRILARGQQAGRLHWLLHFYAMGRVQPGQTATIAEERMLTGGGYYDAAAHYEGVLRAATGGGSDDPSMTYDIGAELNAIAAHILFARTGQYRNPPGAERLATLQAWYDRHLQRYFDFIRPGEPDDLARVFTRGIAFVALSLDCMLRATGDQRYRAELDRAVQLILRCGKRQPCGRDEHDLTFGDRWASQVPFLDNHASCLLALARAARHGDPGGTLAKALREGVLGIKFYSGVVDLGNGHTIATDSLATVNTGGHEHADTGFWNFKLGMVLRALHAITAAAGAGHLALDPDTSRRVAMRTVFCNQLLEQSMRWHDKGKQLEVLTARIAGETNSETQPWVTLGLVPVVDEQIVALAVS